MKTIMLCAGLALVGCASPRQSNDACPGEVAALKAELAQTRDDLSRLENRVGHLVSELSAASAEDELGQMTIASVEWAPPGVMFSALLGGERYLLGNVTEWRGYGKMLRFTRCADPVFYLESHGRPSIEARVLTGGICDGEGSVRQIMIQPASRLEAGAIYRLRSRNENEHYRWSVSADLAVLAE